MQRAPNISGRLFSGRCHISRFCVYVTVVQQSPRGRLDRYYGKSRGMRNQHGISFKMRRIGKRHWIGKRTKMMRWRTGRSSAISNESLQGRYRSMNYLLELIAPTPPRLSPSSIQSAHTRRDDASPPSVALPAVRSLLPSEGLMRCYHLSQ